MVSGEWKGTMMTSLTISTPAGTCLVRQAASPAGTFTRFEWPGGVTFVVRGPLSDSDARWYATAISGPNDRAWRQAASRVLAPARRAA